MELSAEIKNAFKRFGCSVDYEKKSFYVDLETLDQEGMQKATILVRTAYTKWAKMPLLCLVFEISPRKILPRYCYYPFNLGDSSETDFLFGIANGGEIRLTFVSGNADVPRDHKLKPWQSRQLRQMCEVGKKTVQSLTGYDFTAAVKEFEATNRVPQLFERVASDDDIPKIVDFARADAEKVPTEQHALAQELCRRFAHVLKTRSANLADEQIRLIYTFRAALMLFVEFHREFGNYDELAEFLGDIVATKVRDGEVLKASIDWPSHLDTALQFIERLTPAFETNQDGIRSNFFETLNKTLGDVARGRDLSLPMLQGLFAPLHPLLSTRPGRPTEDYSREFEWKHSMSWTQVTRKSLQDNPKIRAEFRGQSFDELDLVRQESLKNRIREGVRSWASRNRKQMPPAED